MEKVRRVLITGVTELIGKIILNDLRGDHDVTGLARSHIDGIRHFEADISDYETIITAFEGQDAVVHLAASVSVSTPWESILKNNIEGTRNVYRACVESGVRRIVFASSNARASLFRYYMFMLRCFLVKHSLLAG